MSCPTCGHTRGGLGNEIFWCERCGTLSTPADTYVPKLVLRCQAFSASLGIHTSAGKLWRKLGIAESIETPQERLS